MKVEEFIKELKPMVRFDNGKHIMGSTILTNKELDRMLEVMLKEDYTKLNYSNKRKIRQRVFKECMEDE